MRVTKLKSNLEKNIGKLVIVGFCESGKKMHCYDTRLLARGNPQDPKAYIFIKSVIEDADGGKFTSGQIFKAEEIKFCTENRDVNYVVVGSPNNDRRYYFEGDLKKLWENRKTIGWR